MRYNSLPPLISNDQKSQERHPCCNIYVILLITLALNIFLILLILFYRIYKFIVEKPYCTDQETSNKCKVCPGNANCSSGFPVCDQNYIFIHQLCVYNDSDSLLVSKLLEISIEQLEIQAGLYEYNFNPYSWLSLSEIETKIFFRYNNLFSDTKYTKNESRYNILFNKTISELKKQPNIIYTNKSTFLESPDYYDKPEQHLIKHTFETFQSLDIKIPLQCKIYNILLYIIFIPLGIFLFITNFREYFRIKKSSNPFVSTKSKEISKLIQDQKVHWNYKNIIKAFPDLNIKKNWNYIKMDLIKDPNLSYYFRNNELYFFSKKKNQTKDN